MASKKPADSSPLRAKAGVTTLRDREKEATKAASMNHSLVNLASVTMKRNPSLIDNARENEAEANYSPLRSKTPPAPVRQS